MRDFLTSLGPWGFTILWAFIAYLCLRRGWEYAAGACAAIAFTFLGTTIVGQWLLGFGTRAPVATVDYISQLF